MDPQAGHALAKPSLLSFPAIYSLAMLSLGTSQVEQPSFLGSLLTTKTWTIQRGFYCCYDVITRTDVRCELCIPGGVVAGAVDATGMVAEVGPANWRNIQVSEAGWGIWG